MVLNFHFMIHMQHLMILNVASNVNKKALKKPFFYLKMISTTYSKY